MKTRKWIAYFSILFMAAALAQQLGRVPTQETQIQMDFAWEQSLPIRSGDPRITAIGGTEVRALVAFGKQLFAAIGYWMDIEKANPALPGAQVLRLEGPGSQWQVDLELRDRTPWGSRKYLAISTLKEVRFTTDSTGRQLADPVDLLLASVWYRERQNIVWDPQPEWQRDLGAGPSAMARVTSFANCNGKLYATTHDTIYERLDGRSPTWKTVFETTIHVQNPNVLLGSTRAFRRGEADAGKANQSKPGQ